ncbi:MAG: hypothetical protein ACK58T_43150 [Phycisphaerae bacterium]|jgi:hypothetical protein
MSAKGNTFENDVVLLTFNGTAYSWNANGNLFISLHTGDPGESGNQQSSECAFGSYARVTVARSGSGFTVSGDTATNAAVISFPECTSGSETVTHVAIGTAVSGTGQILYKGALTASRAVSSGITLQFAIGALSVTEA